MDERNNAAEGTREKLIRAGLAELTEYGIENFSTRRVAKQCGVSCAAPYKHFADTQAFIIAIMQHLNSIYAERQDQLLRQLSGCDSRRLLYEVAVDYVRFLAEHPEFRRVLMMNFRNSDSEYMVLRGRFSLPIYRLVARYCRDVQMTPETRKRKTFMVRSIIYGAAMLFDNGEMNYNEENMAMVASMLDREFDLP